MTKGFFRERKHYSLQEITDNLININMEETRRIVGILKKYGVVKAVKKNKPDFDDLSNEDIVLTDVIDSSNDIEYIFDYVGVVVIEGQVFKCYPKYIKSTEHLFENLKQVLKVIKKYNASEQLIYLFNGEDDSKIFNRLAVSIHLLETYYADGLYTNQKEIIETNGEGEILWDKTINETFAIIQNNKPYYVELQTKNTIDNDYDYFRRLHECVLTQCSRELSDAGLLELFELTEVANLLDEVESGENLTKKQQMFHDRTKVRDLALLTLMLGTGIRVSECVGLDLDDVDLKNNGIKIHRKGGAEVVVYFGEEVRNALCEYMEERKLITPVFGDENALFLSIQKRRIGVRAVENLVKKYAKLVTNLKNITPHKLRSTYGTSLYRETGDIYLVADVLGHKDVNTTKKHYAAIEEDRRRSAAKYVHLRED